MMNNGSYGPLPQKLTPKAVMSSCLLVRILDIKLLLLAFDGFRCPVLEEA